MMNGNKINDPEAEIQRLEGNHIGPVGIFMVFLLLLAMCPVLAWDVVKWFVAMIFRRNH